MTMLALRVQPKAQADIDRIAEYLAARNFETAIRFLLVVQQTFDLLRESPLAGRSIDVGDDSLAGVRRWPVHGFLNYVVYHVPDETTLKIVRVLHGARHRDQLIGE